MAGNELVKDGAISAQEIIDVPEIVVHEEKYYLDSDMVIQYELNMLELPFFSKNGKVGKNQSIKYIFSESTDSYMQVMPSGYELTGQKIPQEFDEKIFLAIMRLAKVNGKTIVTTYYQLLKMAHIKLTGKSYKRVKESLFRLDRTGYYLKNCFYSPLLKMVVPGEKTVQILQNVEIIELDKIKNLPQEMKEQYMVYFKRNKVEEVIKIVLSDDIYANIGDRGYLLYDVDDLLAIESSGERKLYQILMKWSHKGKIKTVDKKCKFLAAKIPLSVTGKNIGNTIRTLKKYSQSLLDHGYLKSYKFIKSSPILESSIVFEMNTETEKQKLLDNANRTLQQGHMQNELPVIDAETVDTTEDERQLKLFDGKNKDSEEFEQLINLLPPEERTKAAKTLIEKHLKENGSEYVESNIRYTVQKASGSIGGYLAKALSVDYAEQIRLKKSLDEKSHETQRNFEEQEKERLKEKERKLREAAVDKFNNLKMFEWESYQKQALDHPQYKFFLKDDVESGKISKEDALKEVVISILSKELSE